MRTKIASFNFHRRAGGRRERVRISKQWRTAHTYKVRTLHVHKIKQSQPYENLFGSLSYLAELFLIECMSECVCVFEFIRDITSHSMLSAVLLLNDDIDIFAYFNWSHITQCNNVANILISGLKEKNHKRGKERGEKNRENATYLSSINRNKVSNTIHRIDMNWWRLSIVWIFLNLIPAIFYNCNVTIYYSTARYISFTKGDIFIDSIFWNLLSWCSSYYWRESHSHLSLPTPFIPPMPPPLPSPPLPSPTLLPSPPLLFFPPS